MGRLSLIYKRKGLAGHRSLGKLVKKQIPRSPPPEKLEVGGIRTSAFPPNCLGNHWTELSAQRVGKEQQGLDTGGPRVLKKERDKLPPYGHLRTGPPVPFKTAQFPTEEPALREMLPRVSPRACSQGCAPKSERKPWACPALSLTGTLASKETSEQQAVSEHLSMLSGGGP